MSQVPVKWCASNELYDHNRKPEGVGDVPVVELSALGEVVEGLRQINTEMHFVEQRGYGSAADKQSCQKAAKEAQRLLARLGEQ